MIHAGSKLLINELPSILDGSAREKAQPQDDSKATLAPKVRPVAHGHRNTIMHDLLINEQKCDFVTSFVLKEIFLSSNEYVHNSVMVHRLVASLLLLIS